MENSTDPKFLKNNFDNIKNRLRQVGVGGVTIAEGQNKHGEEPVDKNKEFENKKEGMSYKNGVAFFNATNKRVPNARKRNDTNKISNIKIFAITPNKPKEKEK